MGRPFEPGIQAMFNYRPVRFSHFNVAPGVSTVLTSDPWSYLYARLLAGQEKRRGANKMRLQRAVYYCRVAEEFYKAATTTPLPVKSTLAYYGMLNLVKCFLSTKGVDLEQTWEHHGLTVPLGTSGIVESKTTNNEISIFGEFGRLLGKPIAKKQVTFKELCSNIPELHKLCHTLDVVTKMNLLPIDIRFLVNDMKSYLFTEVWFKKGEGAQVDTSKFHRGKRKDYFKACPEDGGSVIYRSSKRRKLSKQNWPRTYKIIREEYAEFDIVSLLTRDGYRYYCDLKPHDWHHLCCTLAAMFYLGSVARYRPTETEALLIGEERPLIGELTTTCPQQFLYQLVGLTTDSVCCVPFAKLV
jgi:YaaC-like protein